MEMKGKKEDKPITLDAYEILAEPYSALVDTKFENAYIERPATLSMLPNVEGKKVLDAGCGPGSYSEWLVEHGAKVVAIDVSPKMVNLARKRLPGSFEVHLADLGEPLDFLEEGSFDIVLAPLVLDCIEDWDSLFGEFHRILLNDGLLVFSVCHPFTEFLLRSEGRYFDTELVEAEWKGFGPSVIMPSYRRPLVAMVTSLTGAGFALEKIVEPTPTPDSKQIDSDMYEKYHENPSFLCIKASKISE
jgi:ubiquinone/menaquinone biosynthesis C-methylase UbiE